MDSTLPKDQITVNPHFNGSDPEALAQALHDNLAAYTPTAGTQFSLKIYDAAKAPPSYPLAQRTHAGTVKTSSGPREIAMCLSYYTTYNRPRFRGRLYLPASWFGSTFNVRPAGGVITGVLGFATSVLKPNMPAQTNWIVWSELEQKDKGGVTDIWCDDEWDTVRSRGLVATTRQTAKF
jgi:hypothetical protein